MGAPLISISLPIYNGGHELEARLDDVAAQTCGDFQVLMIDSASTDNTEAIGRQYAARDARFKYFRSRQKMPYANAVRQNIYLGLDSQYLVLTSHSQRWAPTYLEECLNALDKCPQALAAYSWCQFTGEHESWPAELPGGLHKDDFDLSGPDPARRFLNVVEHQKFNTPFFGLIRSEVCLKGLLYPEMLAQEHLMSAALALNGPLIQIERPLLFRRWQPVDASVPDLCRHYLDWPMELKPAPLSDIFGYKKVFLFMLTAFLNLIIYAAPHHLDSRQKESLAGQAAGAFIRRHRKELTAELNADIERVKKGWFYIWKSHPNAKLTSKNILPESLPDEDGDSPPPRPNLDLSVARTVNYLLNYYLCFFPTHPGLNYARGLIYRLLGRRAEAKTALEVELRHNPDYEAARRTLREWEDSAT